MKLTAAAAEEAAILQVAQLMLAAARTAPKGKGRDRLAGCVLTGADKDALADAMDRLGRDAGLPSFTRDAAGVRQAAALVLLGINPEPLGLKRCGSCGFADCAACRAAGGRCAHVLADLGIAVGSAVAAAADARIDNRIMYSAGLVAVAGQLLGGDVVVAYGIPLSVTGKNPFFDRN